MKQLQRTMPLRLHKHKMNEHKFLIVANNIKLYFHLFHDFNKMYISEIINIIFKIILNKIAYDITYINIKMRFTKQK